MKKNLLILGLLLITSCGYFDENIRYPTYKLESGEKVKLVIFERKEFFSEKRNLYLNGRDYNLKGRECEDAELKNFSNELWSETAAQNDLSKIESGTISLFKRQKNESTPEFCKYIYTRKENGEWIGKWLGY